MPQLRDLDLIVSSYGRHPFELKRTKSEDQKSERTVITVKPIMEGGGNPDRHYSIQERQQDAAAPGWRQFMPKQF